MFVFSEFIKTNLIEGVKNGSFSREYANILAANWLSKGVMSPEDVQEVDNATAPSPEPEPELLIWTEGENVEIGDKRIYGGIVYECLQAHMTQTGWEPGSIGSAALWREVM